ncbi:hypothetical protein [Acinetobacter sp. CFCC 10889]|uniref:hypothetical protein n=1 Tax=Acinetobacter sp. CFCC 10889 TaxID=1775557 RepID=UPI001BC88CE6|nr:hypothetical protein [Acinetobacter sp. CFCC 10889]
MKKFKLTWDERVVDQDGETLHLEQKNQVIEAESEAAACEQWKKENEHNENQNGLESCEEVVEHPLFSKCLVVTMSDESQWAVPVEFIARHRAAYYAIKEYEGNIAESLRDDTLPLFESEQYEIHDWAANNMNWSDVQCVAVQVEKPSVDYEDGWCNGEWSIK